MAPIDNKKNSGKKFNITTSEESGSWTDEVISTVSHELEPEKIPGYLLNGITDFLAGTKPDKADIPYGEVFIQTKVAMEFGPAKDFSEWVKELDKVLELQSFYAIKAIKEKAKEGKTDWDSIVAAMHNADGLTMVPDSHKKVYDCWAAKNTNWFKFDGSADSQKVNEIKSWFKKSVTDADPSIYDNSEIVQQGVLDRLAKIAAQTGAKVDSFEHFWANKEEVKDKVLEIGLIRFPTKEDPHVKLYRIEIFAWYNSSRVLMVQNDQAGFDLELDVMKFKAVDALVDKISDEMMEKVVDKLSDPSTFDF